VEARARRKRFRNIDNQCPLVKSRNIAELQHLAMTRGDADGEQSPKKMNPLRAEVEVAHLLPSRSYLLPARDRRLRRRPLLSLISFNSMRHENAGAEECDRRSN
jgi:hypothetical protein